MILIVVTKCGQIQKLELRKDLSLTKSVNKIVFIIALCRTGFQPLL